jgi:putative membrane protein
MKRLSAVAAAAVLGLGLSLMPSVSADEDKDTGKAVNDQTFLQKASACGLAEVNLGRLAIQHATNQDVRKFGQNLVRDHAKANQELIGLANKKGWTLASTMDDKHRAAADKLARMQGADFDRAFMKQMVDDHKEAVKLFGGEAKTGRDTDLKAWASKTLPAFKEHLRMAQDMTGKKAGKGEGKSEEEE